MQSLFLLPCGQMPDPPHSLHWLFCLSCGHMSDPPHSLHRLLRLPCAQIPDPTLAVRAGSFPPFRLHIRRRINLSLRHIVVGVLWHCKVRSIAHAAHRPAHCAALVGYFRMLARFHLRHCKVTVWKLAMPPNKTTKIIFLEPDFWHRPSDARNLRVEGSVQWPMAISPFGVGWAQEETRPGPVSFVSRESLRSVYIFSAFVERRSGGGAAPRSPARSFFPYWVVLTRGPASLRRLVYRVVQKARGEYR